MNTPRSAKTLVLIDECRERQGGPGEILAQRPAHQQRSLRQEQDEGARHRDPGEACEGPPPGADSREGRGAQEGDAALERAEVDPGLTCRAIPPSQGTLLLRLHRPPIVAGESEKLGSAPGRFGHGRRGKALRNGYRRGKGRMKRRIAALLVTALVSISGAAACSGVQDQLEKRAQEEVDKGRQRIEKEVQKGQNQVEEQIDKERRQVEKEVEKGRQQVEKRVQEEQQRAGEGQ